MEIPGRGSNPCHSSHPSHCSDNTRPLTYTGIPGFFFKCMQLAPLYLASGKSKDSVNCGSGTLGNFPIICIFNFFITVLSVYRPFTSLVQFIPKHLTGFNIIKNSSIFFLSRKVQCSYMKIGVIFMCSF